MKKAAVFLAAIAAGAACSTASALWLVSDTGAWPKSWPKALEPLRVKSNSIEHGEANLVIHHIPFTDRDDFEAAWPQLLKVKTKGAPIILVRSPGTHWHFGKTNAGVLVHEGQREQSPWTHIELVVDGEIVDLNRVRLPEGTPIIDERFKDDETKSADTGGE
jgi:hypothetical protein